MAYEKQNWQTGDVVTSAKLNHMEDGIAAGGALVVNVTEVDGVQTCDKTAGEMWAACQTGLVIFRFGDGEAFDLLLTAALDGDNGYVFMSRIVDVQAATENDYPSSGGD